MEVAVSGVIGLLCFLCTFEALAYADARGSIASLLPPERAPLPTTPREVLMLGAHLIGRALHDWGVVPGRLQALMDEACDLQLPAAKIVGETCKEETIGLFMMASVGSGIAAFVLVGSVPGAVLGCCVPAALLVAGVSAERCRRRARVEEAMPEAFGALAVSLGSGLSLSQAMRYVGSHAEEPVRTAFMRVAFSITCGIPAAEALDAMIARLQAPGLELVTLALKVSQRTGAPLKGLLADASKLVGERIELSRWLDVKTSQARMSARLVAGMPVAMIAFLSLLSNDFQKGLATIPGMASIAVALTMNAVAWVAIRKIMRVRL